MVCRGLVRGCLCRGSAAPGVGCVIVRFRRSGLGAGVRQIGADQAGQGFDLGSQGTAQRGCVFFISGVVACAPGFAQQATRFGGAEVLGGEDLLRQETLKPDRLTASFPTSRHQSLGGVFVEFVRQGIHHIFIGPDHILFVIGLLLLGGTVTQLLKIVTAFTIAHSITLALATFRLVTPPAAVVEPVIAFSIVCVGLNAFFGKRAHDPRVLFAFCFGLVHGFGFANVLQEMVLPRQAMGVSLFAFDFGVEIAQVSIVMTVAPLLALLRKRSLQLSDSVVASGALVITGAGAFWFFQRVLG